MLRRRSFVWGGVKGAGVWRPVALSPFLGLVHVPGCYGDSNNRDHVVLWLHGHDLLYPKTSYLCFGGVHDVLGDGVRSVGVMVTRWLVLCPGETGD